MGVGRVADVGFIGFVWKADWDSNEEFNPSKIKLDVIVSHTIAQHSAQERDSIINSLREQVHEQFAVQHVVEFHQKLCKVTPGPGYAINKETRKIREG